MRTSAVVQCLVAFGVFASATLSWSADTPPPTAPASAPPQGSTTLAPLPPRPPLLPGVAPSVGAGAPAPPVQNGNDVVVYRNRMMVRGTIGELSTSSHVTIVMLTGEVRRIPISEVLYAGPIANMPPEIRQPAPGAAAPFGASPALAPGYGPLSNGAGIRPVPLRLTAEQPDVTYHVRGRIGPYGSDFARGYTRLCTAPCELSLPAGPYAFALSSGEHKPIDTSSLTLQETTALKARYAP